MWQLSYTAAAARDLRKVGPEVAGRVLAALDAFAIAGAGDVKKLQGQNPPRWRLRVGDYRAGLALDHQAMAVQVLYVRHRREAYR
jgi:mRNA interferase RelE/StbE